MKVLSFAVPGTPQYGTLLLHSAASPAYANRTAASADVSVGSADHQIRSCSHLTDLVHGESQGHASQGKGDLAHGALAQDASAVRQSKKVFSASCQQPAWFDTRRGRRARIPRHNRAGPRGDIPGSAGPGSLPGNARGNVTEHGSFRTSGRMRRARKPVDTVDHAKGGRSGGLEIRVDQYATLPRKRRAEASP